MFYRFLNLAWFAALAAAVLGLAFEPRPERPLLLGVAVGLIAFRYIVGLNWARSP